MATKLLMTKNFKADISNGRSIYGFWCFSHFKAPSFEDFEVNVESYKKDMKYLTEAPGTFFDNRILMIDFGSSIPKTVYSYVLCYSTAKLYSSSDMGRLDIKQSLKVAFYCFSGSASEGLTLISGARNNLYINLEEEPIRFKLEDTRNNNSITHEHELHTAIEPKIYRTVPGVVQTEPTPSDKVNSVTDRIKFYKNKLTSNTRYINPLITGDYYCVKLYPDNNTNNSYLIYRYESNIYDSRLEFSYKGIEPLVFGEQTYIVIEPAADRNTGSMDNTMYASQWINKFIKVYSSMDDIKGPSKHSNIIRTNYNNYCKSNHTNYAFTNTNIANLYESILAGARNYNNTSEQYYFNNAKIKLLGYDITEDAHYNDATDIRYCYLIDNDNNIYKIPANELISKIR